MSAIEQQDSHRPPSDGGMAKEEFIRVGTTLYKIVEQPKLNGGYIRKRIAWNNETLRQDYGKDYIGRVPKYDGFCTVPEHIGYRSVVGKFLNLYEPIDHRPQEGDLSHIQSLVRHIFGEQYELGMDYLQSLGYTPVKQQGKNLWYKSPLREETDASFKVNTELEKWYDFGIGKGGNIIALAAELYHSGDVAYLLKRIEERTAYIRPASFSFGRQHSDNQPYQGLRVGELSSPALIAYLQERGINIGLAKRECRELRFMNADKPYFAIGFPNMAGGYEVRNRYFKGCVAPKDITHIRQQDGQRCMCYLFEGFMDYLSFLTIRVENNPQHPRLDTQDYIILNSVSNLAKAESILETYTQVGCFLDNDTAGRNTCKKLKEKFGERLLDKSMYYREYKDLNDYLCGKPLSQSAEPIKEKKQVQSARRMMQPPKKKGGFHL